MHDTNPDRKKRMPPLIVLGLTGPVGSGCSTVSKIIFDDPGNPKRGEGNELLNKLQLVRWVRKGRGFRINWRGFNKSIDATYRKLATVDKAIKDFDTCKQIRDMSKLKSRQEELRRELEKTLAEKLEEDFDFREELEGLEQKLGERLKEDLETREVIKALDKLNVYYRGNTHLFRTISVSDLIVFRAIMAIEKENFTLSAIKDKDKKRKYRQFVALAKKHMKNTNARLVIKRIGINGYGDYYKRCYEWKERKELEKLGEAFYDIHKIATVIKSEFYRKHPYEYAEVMQDFGDNIRFCDDPFMTKPPRPEDCAYKLAKGVSQMIYLLYKTGHGAFFVVDCLRNPYEIVYLSREFANFFLLSLYADKRTRENRFIDKARKTWAAKFKEDKVKEIFDAIDKRDSGKNVRGREILYKQNITKCVQVSHIAINNIREWPEIKDIKNMSKEELERALVPKQASFFRLRFIPACDFVGTQPPLSRALAG